MVIVCLFGRNLSSRKNYKNIKRSWGGYLARILKEVSSVFKPILPLRRAMETFNIVPGFFDSQGGGRHQAYPAALFPKGELVEPFFSFSGSSDKKEDPQVEVLVAPKSGFAL